MADSRATVTGVGSQLFRPHSDPSLPGSNVGVFFFGHLVAEVHSRMPMLLTVKDYQPRLRGMTGHAECAIAFA